MMEQSWSSLILGLAAWGAASLVLLAVWVLVTWVWSTPDASGVGRESASGPERAADSGRSLQETIAGYWPQAAAEAERRRRRGLVDPPADPARPAVLVQIRRGRRRER